MRILYFMNHVGRGGAALALYDLIHEIKLNHNYIEPIVITGSKNELNVSLTKIGVENYSAPFKNFLTTYRTPTLFWKIILRFRYQLFRATAIKRIERLIDFRKIDAIHTNLNRIDIGYHFAEKYEIPHFWHVREDGFKGLKLMQILPFHNPIMKDTKANFIVISDFVKNAWVSNGLPSKKINLIYDGINETNLVNSAPSNRLKKLGFVFVGGFHINKGQEVFIHSLGQLPSHIKGDIIVHFYGGSSLRYRIKLKKLLKKYELLDTCQFFEYDPDIYNKLKRYHIGVNCSKAEGFGRITVEYMMAGLCPLISNSGANPEIVDDKINGILFDRDNAQDICNNILRLYNDRDLINSLGMKAKEKAISVFTMKAHTASICDLYRKKIN